VLLSWCSQGGGVCKARVRGEGGKEEKGSRIERVREGK
jgi:hypothetical protein